MTVRAERPADLATIRTLIAASFAGHPHSDGTEPRIVDTLRRDGALSLSLVAEEAGRLVGHVAFSPVRIADGTPDWYGLGPLAVAPAMQRRGIGGGLVACGLERLRDLGAAGCVVLGEPAYYRRFGFRAGGPLALADVPPEFFMALAFGPPVAKGMVHYHPAFTGEA